MPHGTYYYGQDEFKFGQDLSVDLLPIWYWHLVVKMSSNLADLPSWSWHLVARMSSNLADLPLDLLADLHHPPVLTSSGQDDCKFGRSTPQYWYLVVKMSSNLADLPLDLPADLPPPITDI